MADRTFNIGPYTMHVDGDTHVGNLYADNGVLYEGHIVEVLERLAPSVKVFWDIGANAGIHSFNMLRLNPETEVVAFEPNQHMLEYLCRSVVDNGVQDRMSVIPLCLSDKLEIVKASRSIEDTSCFTLDNQTAGCMLMACVPARLIGLPKPDLVKIDVEGFEGKVVSGMDTGHRPVIIFELCTEFSEGNGTNPYEVLSVLHDRGYRFSILNNCPEESIQHDHIVPHMKAHEVVIVDILAEPQP